MEITIATANGKTTLSAPFNPDLSPAAKAIGGRWAADTKRWVFDSRDEKRVRDLAIEIYGTDGTPGQTVTVRLDLAAMTSINNPYNVRMQTLWLAGRRVAHRPSRDERVRLGDAVIVISGGFHGCGGSVANPDLKPNEGTVLEIRDIPAGHADLDEPGVTVIAAETDVEALTAERERLLARIAEIDALLPAPEDVEATAEQAAKTLGVSVRTVQRWAQTGKVEAHKDDNGRWVITITA